MAAKLTPRQRAFVEAYLVSLNAADAARQAGYSPKTANREGSRLLSNVDVQAAIAAAQAERSRRTEVTQDWVLGALRAEASDRGEGSSHSARVSALSQLGKHLGMFVERVKVEGGLQLRIVEEIVDADPDPDGATAPGAAGLPPQ